MNKINMFPTEKGDQRGEEQLSNLLEQRPQLVNFRPSFPFEMRQLQDCRHCGETLPTYIIRT